MSSMFAAVRTPAPLVAAVVVATACSPDSGPRPSAVTSPSPTTSTFPTVGQCRVTLEQFCGGACPSYATTVDRLQSGCAILSLGSRALAGHCPGVFYYTEIVTPISSSTSYYDGRGVMIGSRAGADYNAYCGGSSFTLDAGVLPTCPRPLELEQVCAR